MFSFFYLFNPLYNILYCSMQHFNVVEKNLYETNAFKRNEHFWKCCLISYLSLTTPIPSFHVCKSKSLFSRCCFFFVSFLEFRLLQIFLRTNFHRNKLIKTTKSLKKLILSCLSIADITIISSSFAYVSIQSTICFYC